MRNKNLQPLFFNHHISSSFNHQATMSILLQIPRLSSSFNHRRYHHYSQSHMQCHVKGSPLHAVACHQ
ncbi:hypothetical protein Lalb_Chr01g0013511 [Lupinus albus]|uniref:Uncharacterized protein n=1 Tax=Lupinus albus TaxID=3870 RepID=A0A6A4R606_LUPAL|nr:hypothetical protein Lalb_Chr01g0013511 [Lupinus albus]